MKLSSTPWQAAIDRISKAADSHIEGGIEFDAFEAVVQKELEAAYHRGAESVRNSPYYHQPESMGR